MSKVNTIIIFFSLTVAVAALDFKFNHYDQYSQNKNFQTAIINYSQDKASSSQTNSTYPTTINTTSLDPTSSDASSSDTTSSDSNQPLSVAAQPSFQPFITAEKMTEAGLKDITLTSKDFSGILFEKIDLRDFKSIEVIEQRNIDTSNSVVFYEFHAADDLLSQEIYLFIKNKAQETMNLTVNETNTYGDSSFFLNESAENQSVFLVVRIGNSVYAMSYQKELHDSVKNLLRLLS